MENEISLFQFGYSDGVALKLTIGDSTVVKGYVSTGTLPLQNALVAKVSRQELLNTLPENSADTIMVTELTSDPDAVGVSRSNGALQDLHDFLMEIDAEDVFIYVPIEIGATNRMVVKNMNKVVKIILGSLARLGNGSNFDLPNPKLILSGSEVTTPCSRCNLASKKVGDVCIYDCGLEMCLNSLDATDPTVEQRLNAIGFKTVTINEEVQLCLT